MLNPNILEEASIYLAMVNGQSEGFPLKPESKEGLDKIISSNLSNMKSRNEAAMTTTLVLGIPTSTDKTTYLATSKIFDNAIKALNEKNNENKLAHRSDHQATASLEESTPPIKKRSSL